MAENFDIDFDRTTRLGFPEIIFGATKSEEVLMKILNTLDLKIQDELMIYFNVYISNHTLQEDLRLKKY